MKTLPAFVSSPKELNDREGSAELPPMEVQTAESTRCEDQLSDYRHYITHPIEVVNTRPSSKKHDELGGLKLRSFVSNKPN